MNISRRHFLQSVGVSVSCPALSKHAFALNFPSRNVRVIVPFPPGGPNDVLARTVGKRVSSIWGQGVIVENKAGANTQIGAQFVARSESDGYTLMVTSDTTGVINPLLYRKLPYDALRDFVPISGLAKNCQALFAAPSLQVDTTADLIALAKSKPGELNFGTFGRGSSGHLFTEMFQQIAGVNMASVHYAGTQPALTDLMAGQIQVLFANASTGAPLAKDGHIKILGIGSQKRLAQVPDVPTISESGLPGFDTYSWFGLYAPANVPREIVAKINSDIQSVLMDADLKSNFLDAYMFEPMIGGPEEFSKVIETDSRKWEKVIREANLQLD